ncbi:hypothetical protein NLG97_g6672 [Lecanicillium saksenae]|uniref:Uncharacterized protein n=1 Tax=Lecanicillium saksenae TaxID=468837 RepID=A0ACC1QNZ8_9HYPO|nr:hypothetical protein NLG97_g6672 [Lecanicillium saksenae]
MLTLQQQPTPPYGYRAVHDLPTPPSATKSPVLTYSSSTPSPSWRDPLGPPIMSAPHRGLPPPAAMSMQPQQPPASHPPPHVSAHPSVHPPPHAPAHPPSHQPPPPVHHSQQASMSSQAPPAPPHHHHRDSWGSAPGPAAPLPPPPQHWSSSDESMRNWLQARTEEERTRQEEERTRQEGLRLEQRKIEMDMLRSSIGGGIPPPMIPLVFAGMASGGVLPQAALDWAHQFMTSQSQYPQLPPPPLRPHSPESQRESVAQAPAQYHPANAPPPAHGGYAPHGTSPTRARGQTVSGIMARPGTGSNMSSAGSNTPQSGGLQPSTSTLGPFQPHQPTGGQSGQHDSTLFFHHWQPPASQSGQSAGGSNRPGSPAGESQKKRKAGGDPPHHSRTHSTQRPRSPPSFIQSDFGAAGRKSHKRHKSDVSWYQGPRHSMGPGSIPESGHRARTPAQDNSSTSSKDRDAAEGTKAR